MPISPRPLIAPLTVLALALAGCAGTNADDETKAKGPIPKPAAAARPGPGPEADVPKAFAVNGAPVKMDDLKGRVVLLDFWAMWCGPCIASFPHLRDWHKQYADKGLEVIGATTYWGSTGFDKEAGRTRRVGTFEVDEDTGKKKVLNGLTPAAERAAVKDFAAHYKLDYRILLYSPAEWDRAHKTLGVRGYPTVVLFDRNGAVRGNYLGGSPQTLQTIHEEIRKLLAEK